MQLRECRRPWLMMGVGARWLTKRWPPKSFAALARRAQQQFGGTVPLHRSCRLTKPPLAQQVIAQIEARSHRLQGLARDELPCRSWPLFCNAPTP